MLLDSSNNPDVTRSEFTPVTEENKATVLDIKLLINELLHEYLNPVNFTGPETSRLIALARTHVEIAAMFAVKAYTSEEINKN